MNADLPALNSPTMTSRKGSSRSSSAWRSCSMGCAVAPLPTSELANAAEHDALGAQQFARRFVENAALAGQGNVRRNARYTPAQAASLTS